MKRKGKQNKEKGVMSISASYPHYSGRSRFTKYFFKTVLTPQKICSTSIAITEVVPAAATATSLLCTTRRVERWPGKRLFCS
jgi:hypothetical protein